MHHLTARNLTSVIVLVSVAACSGRYVPLIEEAPTDGGDAEAASPVTNQADALASDAQAPNTPCSSEHIFCDDFDRRDDAAAGWDSLDLRAGPISIDETTATSGLRSLRVMLDGKPGLVGSSLRKTVSLRTGSSSASVEFDYIADFPSRPWPFAEIYPVIISIDPPPAGVRLLHFGITLSNNEERFVYYGEQTNGTILFDYKPITLPYNAWQHIKVAIALLPDKVQARLLINEKDTGTLTYASGAAQSLTLSLGAPFVNDSSLKAPFRYDNVIIDAK